ncbi:hypothetical protein GE09DRAFT_755445 [Coniochaeta sp. 2T2.1]|nr:hypothetical protein GE09DRAFT_755445 [Coniochaeta sp. 2T2.1]
MHLVSPQATGLGARPRRFSVTGGGLPSYPLAAVRLRDNRHFSVRQFYHRILRRPCRTNQIRTCLQRIQLVVKAPLLCLVRQARRRMTVEQTRLTVLGWNHFVMRDLRPHIHFGGSSHRTPTVTFSTGADDTQTVRRPYLRASSDQHRKCILPLAAEVLGGQQSAITPPTWYELLDPGSRCEKSLKMSLFQQGPKFADIIPFSVCVHYFVRPASWWRLCASLPMPFLAAQTWCKSQGRPSVRVGQFKGHIMALLKTETRS